ncbi:hypothetical protein V2J09_022883 [Rumex salicifolius]
MRYFLGVEFIQRKDGIFISQQKYAKDVLAKFDLSDCNFAHSPMVPGAKISWKEGKKLWILLTIRVSLDRYYTSPSLGLIFMQMPTKEHLLAAKRILRYIKGTLGFGIFYKRSKEEVRLIGYTDSDYSSTEEVSINVRFHFLRNLVNEGILKLEHYSTNEQIADIMTKALKLDTFRKLRAALGVHNVVGLSNDYIN